jgi:lipopolysaccharide export system ATP-binding protein
MALLEVRGLEKWYGRRQVVKGVDYDVEPGEVVGLLGPNGAGKTTSFRMTIGLIDADAGTVRFDGKDISRLPMFRRARLGVGYLPQEASVFKQLSVENNLMAILETVPGLSRAERKKRQDKLLEQFGLTHVRKTMANRVSGGERRRVEIARSLVTEPKLIMLDEPFAAIDPKTVSEIQDVIRDLAKSYGIGILLTDHSVERVLESSDRSYLIHDGLVVVSGTSQQILENPQARDVYLGNRIDYAHLLEKRHVHALGSDGRKEPEGATVPAGTDRTASATSVQAGPESDEIRSLPAFVPASSGSKGHGNLKDRLDGPVRDSERGLKPEPPLNAASEPMDVFDMIDPDQAGPMMEIPDGLVVPPPRPDPIPNPAFDMETLLGGSITVSGDVVIEHVDIVANRSNPAQSKFKPPVPQRGEEPGR